ncbi:MAG: glycosyltransferase family 39 protein [Pseudomonadota bacterium]
MTQTDLFKPPYTLLLILLLGTLYRALALHWSGLNLYVDEAQYWTWAQALDWGYYSKPPVIAALIAATTSVFGDSELAVKSGALIVYPLSTLMLYALARRLFDARIAWWTAVSFFTLPGIAFSSLIISTDVPLFLCWTTALYTLHRAVNENDWAWWVALGIACGVGLLTKYTMGIFALSTLFWFAITPALRVQFRRPGPYLTAAVAALLFAPNLWWNHANGWPTFQHTADISNLETGPGLHWDELQEFLSGQAAIMGPVLFIALLVLLARAGNWWRDERSRFLACFTLPFLLLISAQALLGRANANWAAMTYAAGTLWVVSWLLQAHRRGTVIAALVVNLTAMVAAYHYHAIAHILGRELTAKTDYYKRVQGWDVLGQKVSALLAEQANTLLLANERDTMSELRFYARPLSTGAVLWNPQHRVTNHYELVTKMEGQGGRNFLFVSRDKTLPEGMADSFLSVEQLPDLTVPVVPGWSLDYRVWRLYGFIGYPMAMTIGAK